MHADLYVPVGERLHRESIIKVLCIVRVNRAGRDTPEVASLRTPRLLGEDSKTVCLKVLRFSNNAGREVASEPLAKRECTHLGLMLACLPYNPLNGAERVLLVRDPRAEANHNLVAERDIATVHNHKRHIHLL